MKRKREQAPVSIMAWSWEHDWGGETMKQGQTQTYAQKSWDQLGCVCSDRGYQTQQSGNSACLSEAAQQGRGLSWCLVEAQSPVAAILEQEAEVANFYIMS